MLSLLSTFPAGEDIQHSMLRVLSVHWARLYGISECRVKSDASVSLLLSLVLLSTCLSLEQSKLALPARGWNINGRLI